VPAAIAMARIRREHPSIERENSDEYGPVGVARVQGGCSDASPRNHRATRESAERARSAALDLLRTAQGFEPTWCFAGGEPGYWRHRHQRRCFTALRLALRMPGTGRRALSTRPTSTCRSGRRNHTDVIGSPPCVWPPSSSRSNSPGELRQDWLQTVGSRLLNCRTRAFRFLCVQLANRQARCEPLCSASSASTRTGSASSPSCSLSLSLVHPDAGGAVVTRRQQALA
jgi:hypothetical protein